MRSKSVYPLLIAVLVLVLYLSPDILFMPNARYLVHDNLDSFLVWNKMLANSGIMFAPSNAIFHNICNGVPRGCMPSELNLYNVSYCFLLPFIAYNLNIIVIHLVAFAGMYLLVTKYVFKNGTRAHATFIALAFAVLPFWPSEGLAVAGQPFIIWAFLNLLNKEYSFKNWLVIAIMPFYSDFARCNLFFAAGLLVLILVFFLIQKRFAVLPLLGWFLFLALSALVEYRLFYMQFIQHVHSERQAYIGASIGFKQFAETSCMLFLKGQYHFNTLQWPVIVVVAALTLCIIRKFSQRLLLGILLLSALICASMYYVHSLVFVKKLFGKLGELESLQLRFICMLPVLWYLILAFSVYFIVEYKERLGKVMLGIILVIIICNVFNLNTSDYQGSRFAENVFYNTYFGSHKNNDYQTFNEYYCDSLFDAVKNKTGYNKETTLCIGFPSEKAQYNNIYTVAAKYPYLPTYTKQKLVAIFSPELKKTGDTAKQNAMTISLSFQYYCHKINADNSVDLALDTNAMRKMDVHYILSAYSISNYRNMQFDSVGVVYNKKDSFPARVLIYRFR